MKNFVTPKGTTLPLLSLKGKDYMMAAHRLVWFVEENPIYHLNTNFLVLNDDETVAQVTIMVLNQQGQVVKKAMATKRETKKDFPDHLEKSETSALSRALAQLGYGTQFAQADLDEGMRLADSPLEATTKQAKSTIEEVVSSSEKLIKSQKTEKAERQHELTYENQAVDEAKSDVKKPSFRKTKPAAETKTETPPQVKSDDTKGGWI